MLNHPAPVPVCPAGVLPGGRCVRLGAPMRQRPTHYWDRLLTPKSAIVLLDRLPICTDVFNGQLECRSPEADRRHATTVSGGMRFAADPVTLSAPSRSTPAITARIRTNAIWTRTMLATRPASVSVETDTGLVRTGLTDSAAGTLQTAGASDFSREPWPDPRPQLRAAATKLLHNTLDSGFLWPTTNRQIAKI